MVQIRQGTKQLTGREIEGCRSVGDEVSQSSQVFSPELQMVEADPAHQTPLQALSLAVRQPAQLHQVLISEVRNSLPPDEVQVTLRAD